ncbi:MAG: hypothetical protein AMJ93_13400 [Anaerolineae bacterium SM23_84]|nr:MAG: hypothetical protein AMJ93_13400 [Anaerolineae bacterium SM23_84]
MTTYDDLIIQITLDETTLLRRCISKNRGTATQNTLHIAYIIGVTLFDMYMGRDNHGQPTESSGSIGYKRMGVVKIIDVNEIVLVDVLHDRGKHPRAYGTIPEENEGLIAGQACVPIMVQSIRQDPPNAPGTRQTVEPIYMDAIQQLIGWQHIAPSMVICRAASEHINRIPTTGQFFRKIRNILLSASDGWAILVGNMQDPHYPFKTSW